MVPFWLIRRLMEGDANKLPLAMYYALEAAFCAMDIEDKEKFLSYAYFETDRRLLSDPQEDVELYSVTMQLSDVFWTMAELHATLRLEKMPTLAELNNPKSDVHKDMFNTYLLNSMLCYGSSIQIPYATGPGLQGTYEPVVSVSLTAFTPDWSNYAAENYVHNYAVSFSSYGMSTYGNNDFKVYQYIEGTSESMLNEAMNLSEGLRVNLQTEQAKKQARLAADLLITLGLEAVPGGNTLAMLLFIANAEGDRKQLEMDAARINTAIDNQNKLLFDVDWMQALGMGASLTVTSDGAYSMNNCYVQENELNLNLRAYCHSQNLTDAEKWQNYSATNAAADAVSKIPRNDELSDYVSWYQMSVSVRKIAVKQYEDNLKQALAKHPIEGKTKPEQLTFEEMLHLEQYF